MTVYFTSISANYLAKARILCLSLKKFNPGAVFVLAIADELPSGVDEATEPFDHILHTRTLDSLGNRDIFYFKHSVTEICTAVKPFAALEIIRRYQADKVIYLDPDIAVFSSLAELEQLLDRYSMLLTPHQLQPETEDSYVVSNEILFLKRGAYNLGFFAVHADEEGLRFLQWWRDRLAWYCFDDDYELLDILGRDGLLGMFTDQKWMDLVPSFFDNYHILKDPGYNVSTWNMSKRLIKKNDDGCYTVNGGPLHFFHFSGFDAKGHHNEMQRAITHNPANREALSLTHWYETELSAHGQEKFETIRWPYSHYSNGVKIENRDRKIFHIRKDVYHLFPNPFNASCAYCYFNWVREEYAVYFQKKPRLVLPTATELLDTETVRRWKLKLFPPLSRRKRWAKALYHKMKK